MLSLPSHHLGDAWFHAEAERVHAFFLVCPEGEPRHLAWDIGHASSTDLRTWIHHGIALRRGPPGAWDAACLATGSVLRRGGRFWMAYTGNWIGPRPAVGMAWSADLHHWQKLDANPVTAIDERLYTSESRGRRRFPHWRDPFLFEVDGVAHQLVCATAADGATRAGTIGAARSFDLVHWELLPPLDVEPFAEELECPQVVYAAGRHYLVFSTPAGLRLSDEPAAPGEPGHMYAMVGEGPLGPFRVADPAPLFPAGLHERPYAGRIVEFDGRLVLLGTLWSDAGDRISDPVRVEPTDTGLRVCA
jgi:beta-fructofuranosidase